MVYYTVFFKVNGEKRKKVIKLNTCNPSATGARYKFMREMKGTKDLVIISIQTGEF